MDTYANSYGYTSDAYDVAGGIMGGMVAGVFAFAAIILLIILAVYVIGVIGQWKVFKKANQPGWAALIPFYNSYIACKISGVNPWWVLISVGGSFILPMIPVVGSILSYAVSIYFLILLYVSLAKSFGKETGFAVGLILLNPFFMLALGVGKSQYVGPKPMKDFLFDSINKNNNQNNMNNQMNNQNFNNMNNGMGQPMPTANPNVVQPQEVSAQPVNNTEVLDMNQNASVKFCTGCGSQLAADAKFCTTCGKQV